MSTESSWTRGQVERGQGSVVAEGHNEIIGNCDEPRVRFGAGLVGKVSFLRLAATTQ